MGKNIFPSPGAVARKELSSKNRKRKKKICIVNKGILVLSESPLSPAEETV